VAINGGDGCVTPSIETAMTGRYIPLSRPLFIYVAREALTEPAVRDFTRFFIERAATDLVSAVGYVPITTATRDENHRRLEAAVEEVAT
jgi:phosphate transport system substrate-binding protein